MSDSYQQDTTAVNNDGYFDERVAATYDDNAEMFDPGKVEPVVNFLAKLAGDGNALEFGIGTGRIAIPLAQVGVPIHGIDMSRAMISKLESKAGSSGIAATAGDFSTTRVEQKFSLVYLVFNTIMNLTSQSAQVACFRNAAAHLEVGGYFVIETMVPMLQRLACGETFVAWDVSETHWGVDEYDVASQGLVSHHLRIQNGDLERSSIPFRYVWPAELDLMAELADMTLSQRSAGWKGEPFTHTSQSHVSVWTTARAFPPSS